MDRITSRANPAVTDAVKLRDKRHRDDCGCFFFEGKKLLTEACASGIKISHVFATEDFASENAELLSGLCASVVSDAVYEKLTVENAPQGVFCIAEKTACAALKPSMKTVFLLSEVADPGNVGTSLRCASALGVDAVVLDGGCADIFNPKTVRASMGAVFRLPVIRADNSEEVVADLHSIGFTVFAAVLDREAKRLGETVFPDKTAILLGNEGHGLSLRLITLSDVKLYIPIADSAESLNVGTAAAVFMWECKRQREKFSV